VANFIRNHEDHRGNIPSCYFIAMNSAITDERAMHVCRAKSRGNAIARLFTFVHTRKRGFVTLCEFVYETSAIDSDLRAVGKVLMNFKLLFALAEVAIISHETK